MYKPLTEENVKDFPNFKYSEFKCECKGKWCNGYPVPFSYELAKNLQKIRTHFGKPLHITSAIRCQKYNDSLSGSIKKSKHVKGWAVDFYISGVSYDTLAKYVKTLPYFNYCYRIKPKQNVIHYDIIPPEEDLVTPTVKRDENKDQLKVITTELRVRAGHSTNSKKIGVAKKDGIYNYYETYKDSKYTWYRIADKQWIANDGKWLEVYPKKESGNMEELKKQLEEANSKIQELTLRVAEQESKITNLETLNSSLQKENQDLLNDLESYKKIYTCTKTDNYKIKVKLYENESLYVKGVE